AADLVTRKLGYEAGGVLASLFAEIASDCGDAPGIAELAKACAGIADWMSNEASLDDKLAGSVPFCTMSAVAVAGWQLQRQARDGAGGEAKRVVARFFATQIATEALGLKAAATAGAGLLYALDAEVLAG
ncbi:MAG: acyl-CoA dehydrogenase, partial [Novosphingobium sp.]|nr:acyl-CoA dehydrogenase [Novosphingobium sp.]